MLLYVLRHGPAVFPNRWAGSDRDRPLSEDGRRLVRRAGRAAQRIGLRFGLVIVSPYTRTLETARLFVGAEADGPDGPAATAGRATPPIETSDYLVVHGDAGRLVTELAERDPTPGPVLLVSHEPVLCDLVAMLGSGNPDADVVLAQGALGKLSIRDRIRWGPCAEVEWILPPERLIEWGEEEEEGPA